MILSHRFRPIALLVWAATAASLPATPAVAAGAAAFVSQGQRITAAATTAQSGSNACAAIQPFYWEIGNRNSALASGSVSNKREVAGGKTAPSNGCPKISSSLA